MALILPLAGCQLLPEVFNEDLFLSAVGLQTGSQNQVTPNRPDLILVKFTNQTQYPIQIGIRIHRPSGIDGLGWKLAGPTTVGQIVENCDTDPPTLIRLRFLGEGQDVAQIPGELFLPYAFVWVNAIPTVVSKAPPPLEKGVDYNCGDTVEYIVRPQAGDQKKFEIIVAVYRSPGMQI